MTQHVPACPAMHPSPSGPREPCTLALVAAAALWPCSAHAADSPFGAALQAIAGLGIVLALIAGAAALLKRVTPGRFGATSLLKPVATLAVGPRERVVVVEMGETWLVLGITANSVTTLHTLPKGELPAMPDAVAERSAFASMLRRARGADAAR